MGIGEDVALVELQNIATLFTPVTKRYTARGSITCFHFRPQEFFVEDSLQCGWPQFDGRLQSLAADGVADCLSGIFFICSHQPLCVIGFM